MLVAAMKPGDRIPVPGHPGIFLTCVRVVRGKAVLGVTAPPSVPVLRGELLDREKAPPACGGGRS